MNLDSFTGAGSTPSRRRFWDKVTQAVLASQKIEGKNVSVAEFPGMGTIINAKRDQGTTPIEACPDPISLSFSGVTFDCDCTPFDDPPTQSFIVTDEGDVNSLAMAMDLNLTLSTGCSDCPDGPGSNMAWANTGSPPLAAHCVISYWNEEGDCSGGPSGTDFNEYLGVVMVLISGVYHLIAYFRNTLVFYGTTTDLTSPIANLLTECDASFTDYSGNPAFSCVSIAFFGGTSFTASAHGGTATITT